MSEELEDIVENIKQPSVWIRVLFMIVFGVASYLLILPLIIILSIAQALFTLITGEANANLRYFSATLDLYISQIIKFLTYLSEDKPFPFSDFPELEDNSLSDAPDAVNEAQADSEAGADRPEAASVKKPAAKKTASKKASVKKPAAKKAAKKRSAEKVDSAEQASDESLGDS